MTKSKRAPFLIDGVHPLIVAAERCGGVMVLARSLGHKTHATISIYCTRARRRKSLTIPAEWVLPLARVLKVLPYELRPDLYLPHWELTT